MAWALALLAAVLAAAVVCGALTPAMRRWALAAGLVDRPEGHARKTGRDPVPYGGGVALFLSVTGLGLLLWGGAALAGALDWTPSRLSTWPRAAAFWREGLELGRGAALPGSLVRGAALWGGGFLVFALGLYDDWRPLRARTKLAAQSVAALAALAAGFRATFPEDLLGATGAARLAGALLTVGWILLVTNAFNLLDNMDGLMGGVTAWASLLFGVVAWQHGQALVATTLMLLCGASIGFLRHNWPPAKLYMGDAGALFAGYLLGVLTIGTHFYAGRGGMHAVATPVCVLAVPLYDSLSVLYIRRRLGRPLFEGDRNHLSHRLVRLGLSPAEAVGTICLLTAVTGGLATLLAEVSPAGAATVFGLVLGILALMWLLETAARRRPDGSRGGDAE